jgi:(E)-4-hydroxy-3-methylbut-2-enyl-diphosphate synthase
VDGKPNHKVKNDVLIDHLENLIREKIALKQEKDKDLIARS